MSVQQTPHSTENYAIPKGILYIASWDGDTAPEDAEYEDIGNCSDIQVTPAVTRKPHVSGRTSIEYKDKNPVIKTDYSITFDTDEMAAVNLNRYLSGTLSGTTIYALQEPDKEFALKFISDNPVGPNATWDFWRGTLTPNGPLQLVGGEGADWQTMSFLFEGLEDTTNHSTSPYFNVSYSSSSSSLSSSSSSSSSSSYSSS